jgi:outer membrane lipoprotein SlyB
MRGRTMMVALVAVAVAGCSVSQSTWTPTVDTYGDSRAQYVSRDMQECRELAMQASGSSTRKAVEGGAVGGLIGAAAGAALGAAFGSPGTGAAVGAAAGGLGTGAVRGVMSEQDFKSAFRQCMRNRGHTVLD